VPNVGKSGPSEPVPNDRTLWSVPWISIDDAVRGDDLFQGAPRYDGRVCSESSFTKDDLSVIDRHSAFITIGRRRGSVPRTKSFTLDMTPLGLV